MQNEDLETGKIHKISSSERFFTQPNKPDFLYKYQPVTEYSIQNLMNGKLWSSFPKSFNDPFEYKHNVVGEAGKTDWDELYKSVDSLSIICLTEVPDDLLMWAHYANSHTGFCLRISISTLTNKVLYADEYPTLDFTKDKKAQILDWWIYQFKPCHPYRSKGCHCIGANHASHIGANRATGLIRFLSSIQYKKDDP